MITRAKTRKMVDCQPSNSHSVGTEFKKRLVEDVSLDKILTHQNDLPSQSGEIQADSGIVTHCENNSQHMNVSSLADRLPYPPGMDRRAIASSQNLGVTNDGENVRHETFELPVEFYENVATNNFCAGSNNDIGIN